MKDILIIVMGVLLFLHPGDALADEIELVNRPINTSGLTGLLITTSPFTLPPGTVEIGASILSESSILPDYTITEYPLSAAFGFTNNSEFGFKCSYFNITEGPTGTRMITRQTGDIELSYKWNFIQHQEDSIFPGIALIIGGMIPTDDNIESKTNSVSEWGVRLGLTAGTEIIWKDYALGIYADGQIVGQDLNDDKLNDTSWMFNAGLLFPISKYQNLQMLIEYSLTTGKDITTLSGSDNDTLTYGLRLVTKRFNLTIGNQNLHKRLKGYDNSGRVIGLMSIKFK